MKDKQTEAIKKYSEEQAKIIADYVSNSLIQLENSIVERLESLKGNWGCDYNRNCHIDECISQVRKVFKGE